MPEGFEAAVHRVLRRVPAGKVVSYGQLGLLAGRPRAARLVGWAMRRADGQALPCHRVVFSDGRLCAGDVFGAPDIQRALLRAEGVPFLQDGRVDMKQARWDGP